MKVEPYTDSDLDGPIDGVPAYRTHRNATGGLSFKCAACGQVHSHSADTGHKAPHCPLGTPGRERGYYLLPPQDDQQEPA